MARSVHCFLRFLGLPLTAFVAGALGGCDSNTPQLTACADDSVCPAGTVCVSGACRTQPCGTSGDCENTQVCIAGACGAAQCGCLACADCPTGQTCTQGKCVAEACTGAGCEGGLCTQQSDCKEGNVCDGGSCRPCQGAECDAPKTCVDTGCDPGKTCNATSGLCEDAVTAPASEACDACQSAAECPSGWQCLGLQTGKACLAPCTSGDECPTGWTCWGDACTPAGFACTGCAIDGCAEGETCDTAGTYACKGPLDPCQKCSYDWECGLKGACHSFGVADKRCVPRCTGGASCPSDSTCKEDGTSNILVCEPNSLSACCFEENPADCGGGECGPCPTEKPHCKNTMCVACLTDAHCTKGTCDQMLNTCVDQPGQCPAGKVFNPTLGTCTQCASNADCSGFGGTCDDTGTCTGGGVCATCEPPYPACVKVGGDYYCVQCAVDADCGAGGTCNAQTYACSGGVITPTDKCATDADCNNSGSFVLACDVATGYCYDATGQCDEISAFCTNGGTCYFSELAKTFKQMAGGGVPFAGNCQCDPTAPQPCSGELDCVAVPTSLDAQAGNVCSNTCNDPTAMFLWTILGGTCPP